MLKVEYWGFVWYITIVIWRTNSPLDYFRRKQLSYQSTPVTPMPITRRVLVGLGRPVVFWKARESRKLLWLIIILKIYWYWHLYVLLMKSCWSAAAGSCLLVIVGNDNLKIKMNKKWDRLLFINVLLNDTGYQCRRGHIIWSSRAPWRQ